MPEPNTPAPLTVFCSYAHANERHADEFRKAVSQLVLNGEIELWHDRRIVPGQDWDDVISAALGDADMVVLLVTKEFLNSKYIQRKEVVRALERAADGTAAVIPVVVEPVYWTGSEIATLQALPKDRKAVTLWRPRDLGWMNVAEGLAAAVADLRQKREALANRPSWAPPPPLYGQEQPRRKIGELVTGGACLVTLTGPPGVGKSHLAAAAGLDVVADFADGCVRALLAPLQSPDLVLFAIGQAVGFVETSGTTGFGERLHEFIGDKHLLLLLDGFEKVLAAKDVVSELLAACPNLRVLVTSRGPLGLDAEQVLKVDPLPVPALDPLPPLDELAANPAVALFVARATSVDTTFTLTAGNAEAVAAVCDRVNGLPLAVRLVASSIRFVAPADMLARLPKLLDKLDQVLESTIQPLDVTERKLFARLSVFVRGATLEACEAVCDLGDLTEDVVTAIGRFVDLGLLVARPSHDRYRYVMLEPIRDFARDMLRDLGELDDMRRRHIEHFTRLAEEAEPELEGSEQADWLPRLAAEHDNFRVALDRSRRGDVAVEAGLRLAGALGPLWYVQGRFTEGRVWLTDLLGRGGGASAAVRAKALDLAAILTYHQSDYAAAEAQLEEALQLFDGLDEDEATTSLLRELNLASKAEGLAKCLNGLGFVAKETGRYEESIERYRKSLDLYRSVNRPWGIAWSATDLALVLLGHGQASEAVELLDESLALQQSTVQQPSGTALAMLYRAYAARAQGDEQDARARAEQSLAMAREISYGRGVALASHFAGLLRWAAGELGAAKDLFGESLEARTAQGDRTGVAECFESLAAVARGMGQADAGGRLLGAAMALWAQTGGTRVHPEYGDLMAELDASLDDLRAEEPGAVAAGRSLSLKDAVAYAEEWRRSS